MKRISRTHKERKLIATKRILLAIIIVMVIAIVAICVVGLDTSTTSFKSIESKQKSNICVLVESGHGGISNGIYLTSGKQSPEWADGLKIYEGYSCKLLATNLVASLLDADIDAFLLNSEPYDYSNIARAEKVNNWLRLDNRIILVSIHHNAQNVPHGKNIYIDKQGLRGYMSVEDGGATGIEIFTSVGKTKSDLIADYIYVELKNEFPELKFRCDWSDGDADKEANFTVLTATNCPAVLIEFMFMTTYTDCIIIASKEYRRRFIQAITRALVNYNLVIK